MGVQVELQDIQSGFLSAAAHTANNTLIETALNKALDRTASVDNAMEVDLDMGNQRAINLKDGVLNSDAVNLRQLNGAISAAGSGLIATQREAQTGADVVGSVSTFAGITYTVGGNNLFVFRNGVLQNLGVDYTETTTSSITWLATVQATDDLLFVTNIATTNEGGELAANVLRSDLASDSGSGLIGRFDSISGLLEITPIDGATYEVKGYHSGSLVGGGAFVYDAIRSQTEHNGVNIIGKDATFPTDWTSAVERAAWYAGAGAGIGCFVSIESELTWKHAGAKGDGVTLDDESASAYLAYCKENSVKFLIPSGVYQVSDTTIENLTSDSLASNANNGITVEGVSLISAIIRADATFPSGTPIINLDGNINGETEPANAVAQNGNKIKNVTIDCNNVATIGMRLRAVAHSVFDDVYIKNIAGDINSAGVLITGVTAATKDDTDTTFDCDFNRLRIDTSAGWGVLGISNRVASIRFNGGRARACTYDGMRLSFANLALNGMTFDSNGGATSSTSGGFSAVKSATGAVNRGLQLNNCQFENNYNHEVNIDWCYGWEINGGLFTPYTRAASGQDVIRLGKGTTGSSEADGGSIRDIRVAVYSTVGPVIGGINVGDNARNVSIDNISYDDIGGTWDTFSERYTISSNSANIKIDGVDVTTRPSSVLVDVAPVASGTVANITGAGVEYTTSDLVGASSIVINANSGPQRVNNAITSASISGTTLTVTAITGTPLQIGNRITGTDVAANTYITAFVSGTGGAGTYTVNRSQTVSSTNMVARSTQWFDRSTGEFSAPSTGRYNFELKWPLTGWGGAETDVETYLIINPAGSATVKVVSLDAIKSAYAATDTQIFGGSVSLLLTSGDIVVGAVKVNGGTQIVDLDRASNGFVFTVNQD